MARNKTAPSAPDFCRRYVYITASDRLYDRKTGNLITVQAACRRHANEVPGEVAVQSILLKGANAVDKVDAITFWPGQPELVDEDGGRKLNLWTPPTLQPRVGSARPFTEHVAKLVDHDEVAVGFVLDYLAHLVQHPDRKIRSALLFIGRPGTGKSILADIAIQLVGERNAAAISADQLASNFNGWIEGTGLTVVEELVGDNSKFTAAKLKNWISDERLQINRKGIDSYECRNRTNFILLSNDHDAAIVSQDDRRYFIWRSPAAPQRQGYYRKLKRWLAGGGNGRVLQFLRDRDISRFDPFAPPPRTASRAELAGQGRSEIETYLANALEAAEAPFACDLVVVNHVCDYLGAAGRTRATPKVIAQFLKSIGAVELGQKRIGNTKPRVWAIRRVDDWKNATEEAIANAYQRPGEPMRSRQETAQMPVRRRKLG